MPIPLLVWGAIAAGGIYVAYKNRAKISEFLESEAGADFMKKMGEVMETTTSLELDETKERMVGHIKHLLDIPTGPDQVLVPQYLRALEPRERRLLVTFCDMQVRRASEMSEYTLANKLRNLAARIRDIQGEESPES